MFLIVAKVKLAKVYIFHLFIQEDYTFSYKTTYETNTNVYNTIQIKAMVTFMMH